jgi:hypothetical protein
MLVFKLFKTSYFIENSFIFLATKLNRSKYLDIADIDSKAYLFYNLFIFNFCLNLIPSVLRYANFINIEKETVIKIWLSSWYFFFYSSFFYYLKTVFVIFAHFLKYFYFCHPSYYYYDYQYFCWQVILLKD